MINIKIEQGHISVHGHARSAPVGQDIVCAAISTLTQNLIASIENLTEDKITYSVNPGMVDICYRDLSEASQLLVSSFLIGVDQVAEAYPDYINITNGMAWGFDTALGAMEKTFEKETY